MMAGPQWIRLDVGYFTNPKILRAGTDAALMHLAAICYLGAHDLEAGVLPTEAVPVVAAQVRIRNPDPVVNRLVTNNLWHRADLGYLVHHYDIMNGENSEAGASRRRQRDRRAKQLRDEEGRFA